MTSAWSSGSTFQSTTNSGSECFVGTSHETGYWFKDFLPDVRKPGGFFTSATYETFRTLIDRANEWLRANRKWKIITCESVEFKSRRNDVDTNKMTYVEHGETLTSYVRGLRLWLGEWKNEDEREQQIGYMNLVPERLEKGGIFKSDTFESIDSVIEKFNSRMRFNPLSGRVITIETQEMKLRSFKEFDPDRSNWYESGDHMTKFLFVIRVFYEIMNGYSEDIGIQDFVPDRISEGGIISLPKYEPFSNLVYKASRWCSQHQEIRICNAQSVEIKLKRGSEINTQKMDYIESGTVNTFYVRILRVTYTKPQTNQYSQTEKPAPIQLLTCKTFVPMQLTKGIFLPDYESLNETKKRVTAWIKATGAEVVSAETAAIRICTGGERKYGTETTFTYNIRDRSEYWIFVFRLYLNGTYKEPPIAMLPPVPELQETNCCQIL